MCHWIGSSSILTLKIWKRNCVPLDSSWSAILSGHKAFSSKIPRLLIVDEAATLMVYESGQIFLEDLVRRARKHYLGVIVISQHPGIFQGVLFRPTARPIS